MRHRKKLIVRLFKILFLLVGSLFLVLAIFFWLKSDFWRVKKITCQLNGQECSAEIKAELLRIFQADNLLFLSSSEIIKEVEKSKLIVTEIEFQKNFPDGLTFQFKQRKPQVAVTTEGGSEFYLVDQEGVLIEKITETSDLPLLFTSQFPTLVVGERLEQKEVEDAVFILVELQLRLLKPKLGKIVSEREIEIWLGDDVRAIFSAKKDLVSQLDSLQLILSRTKIEGEKLKQVDLRFDKPVVTHE